MSGNGGPTNVPPFPLPALTTALYERFSSRGEADFANKLLFAMRYQFGGHLEKSDGKSQAA